jgi:3,4-dihydroxy 2-butanone 4-phosphate synthase/GTP cyclohydrolase II
VPLTPHPNDHNLAYLLTKRDRMGHDLPNLNDDLTDDLTHDLTQDGA